MSKVCAGITTFNRAPLLERCVQSLMRQSTVIDQVFIVDNGSHDSTKQTVGSLSKTYPGKVTYIRHESNEGSAGGFADAARAAFDFGADWIWLIDDDVVAEQDALAALLDCPHANDPETGALGCLVLTEKGDRFAPNIQCRVDRITFAFSPVTLPASNEPTQVDTNSFDGFFVHRRAVEKCGFPDKELFLWFDDIDFSLRISRYFNIWLVPKSRVIHGSELQSSDRKIPLLRSPAEVYEWNGCWKMYYRIRNFYCVARKNSGTLSFHKKFFKHLGRHILVPILLRQDNILQRLKLTLLAGWDGYWGKLGKSMPLSPPYAKKQKRSSSTRNNK